MIRFWTRSLRYSTDVPGASNGLCAPAMVDPTVSECKDCASHSRAWGAVVVVAAKDKLVAFEANEGVGFKDWGAAEPDEEVDLKEERRFWAEDLRRIVGRCGCGSLTNMLKAVAPLNLQIRRMRPTPGTWRRKLKQDCKSHVLYSFLNLHHHLQYVTCRYQLHRKAVHRLLLRDIRFRPHEFAFTLCSSTQLSLSTI